MVRIKFLNGTLIIVALIVLSALGGVWGKGLAQGTIPTETIPTETIPTEPKPDEGGGVKTPTPDPMIEVIGQIPGSGGKIDLVTKGTVSASVELPACSLYTTADVKLYLLPMDKVPKRSQLIFHRKVLQFVAYSNSKPLEELCPFKVHFYLTGYERFVYDNYPSLIAMFQYNPADKAWQECTNVTFDPDQGKYGRLTCETTKPGFFALGRLP